MYFPVPASISIVVSLWRKNNNTPQYNRCPFKQDRFDFRNIVKIKHISPNSQVIF